MKLVPITHLPEKKQRNNKITDFLIEFLASGHQYAIVAFTSEEYATGQSLCNALHKASRENGLPIRVTRRGDKVYLEKL